MTERFKWELDTKNIEQSLADVTNRVRKLAETHRYSKVRLSWKGKPLLPDIPLAAFVAGEAASLWLAGPVRILLFNLGVGSIIDVDLVNEADERVAAGRQLFMDGELQEAEEQYRLALKMRPGDVGALYNLAVLLRVSGRRAEAVQALEQALSDGAPHPDREKAESLLEKMR